MSRAVASFRFAVVALAVGCASAVGCSGDDTNSTPGTAGSRGSGGSAGSAGKAGSTVTSGSTVTGTGGKTGSTGIGGSAGSGSSGTAGSTGQGGASGAAGASGASGSGGAGGSMAGAGGGGGRGGGGRAVDAGTDRGPDVASDTGRDAGGRVDAASNDGGGSTDVSVGPDARPDSAAPGDAPVSDVVTSDASCLGSIPLSPDAGGNAANVAQGGSVMLGGDCGNVPLGEMAAQAFDNSVGTKWICFLQTSAAFELPSITYRFAGGSTYAVNAYTVTSANDEPGRDPRNWQLEGSNDDGATWTVVDAQTDQTFVSRMQTNAYVMSNCSPYGRYRLAVNAIAGIPSSLQRFQVAEIQLFGPQGHGPTGLVNRAIGGTVTTTSICGGLSINETPAHAFDGDLGSKWFCGANAAPSIDIALTAAHAINSYSVTAANDNPDRDPQSWMLQGLNDVDGGDDASTWITLDTQTNQAFANRFQTFTYSFTNATTYSHYRFVVTANAGSVDFQVGEIMLFGN